MLSTASPSLNVSLLFLVQFVLIYTKLAISASGFASVLPHLPTRGKARWEKQGIHI